MLIMTDPVIPKHGVLACYPSQCSSIVPGWGHRKHNKVRSDVVDLAHKAHNLPSLPEYSRAQAQ